jgi:SAM-dependent methyltransferase
MTDTVVIFGNCQAMVIDAMSRGLWQDKYEFVYVPSAASIGETVLPDGVGERCVLLIEQVGIGQSFPFLDRLSPALRRVRFPPLNLVSLWPFTCSDPRNRPAPPELPFGRYPYGDRIALRVWAEGYRGREAVAKYSEASARAMIDVTRLLDKELIRAELIEAECEVKIIKYIKENFRTEWLFYTDNHPSMKLIHILFQNIWEKAETGNLESLRTLLFEHEKNFLSNLNHWRPFVNYRLPIHPEVARQLQLDWWHIDLKYFVEQIGREVTHDEFFEWYLSESSPAPRKTSRSPVFENLTRSRVCEAGELRHGIAILGDCMIINPDGTGFGGGALEIEIVNPREGDRLCLRQTSDVSTREGEIYFNDRLVARNLAIDEVVAGPTAVRLHFEPEVYLDAVAALLAAVELCNSRPSAGTRNIALRVTDADNDSAAADVEVELTATAEGDVVAAFGALSPDRKRVVLTEMMRRLTPDAFIPHFRPAPVDLVGYREFREYAAFELEVLYNAQSIGFMVEMIPLMYPYLTLLQDKKKVLRCLDVGPRTGAGSALLATVFQAYFAVLKIETDTIDLDGTFRDYQIARWPALQQVLIGNIFDLEDASYDIVISSHTIEHQEDPLPFARKLSRLARDFAFIYCPYDEINPIQGHHRVGDAVVDQLQPVGRQVVPSWWYRTRDALRMHDCIFFVLSGTDRKE